MILQLQVLKTEEHCFTGLFEVGCSSKIKNQIEEEEDSSLTWGS